MASSSSSSSSHLVPRYDQDRLDSIKNKNKWTKPEFGWYKLNIDASVFHENGKLTAGGLIRDFEGKWVVGFTANLITCNSLSASLQAISVGLNLAWNQGLKNVIIESDYGDAVNLIENSNLNHRLDHNIEECRDLMRRDWSVKLNRIDRRKNKCANALARLGRHQIEPLKIMFEENIPKSVNHFYKESVLRTHQDILDSIARKNKYKWLKPEFGWYKLNADASVFYETGGKSTAGGLIRNFEGRWVVGFTANLIPCDSLSAELQAISIGLNLAWNQGLKKSQEVTTNLNPMLIKTVLCGRNPNIWLIQINLTWMQACSQKLANQLLEDSSGILKASGWWDSWQIWNHAMIQHRLSCKQ